MSNMKLAYIIVVTFSCALALSEQISEEDVEVCASSIFGNGKNTFARNCLDLQRRNKESGVYLITPCDDSPTKVVRVYCDMETDGGGWTVIQRRDNYIQQEVFYNMWDRYATGFGDVSKDFWLGNDNIHCLTHQNDHEIRFDLEDFDGNVRYAKYGFFYVDDRSNLYKLGIQDYSGNAEDALGAGAHNNQCFSTYDQDNDMYSGNCAQRFKGGWWYSRCLRANPNGLYNSTVYGEGVNWVEWKGVNYSLKKIEMKIRGKN